MAEKVEIAIRGKTKRFWDCGTPKCNTFHQSERTARKCREQYDRRIKRSGSHNNKLERNLGMYQEFLGGDTCTQIAKRYEISRGRACQIIKKMKRRAAILNGLDSET